MKINKITTTSDGEVIIETTSGIVTLYKFGTDWVSICQIPDGFSKQCSLYLEIKKSLKNKEDLKRFIGETFVSL